MNSRIRFRVKPDGRYETDPLMDSSGNSYTLSISRDFIDSQVIDQDGIPVAQIQGSYPHNNIIQALKNYLINETNVVLNMDNKVRDSGSAEATSVLIQTLDFSAVPTSGSFVIEFTEGDSDPILASDSAADAQATIRETAGLELVTVSGSYEDGFELILVGSVEPDPIDVDDITLQVDSVQVISFDLVPDDGEFTLDYDGDETDPIAFDATAADVQDALRAITGLEDVTVSGDFEVGFTVIMVQVVSPEQIDEGGTNDLESDSDPVVISFDETIEYEDVIITVND